MALFRPPLPAGALLYDANAPHGTLIRENNQPVWLCYFYGWRDGRLGNHLYKWDFGRYAVPQYVWVEMRTEERAELRVENNQIWLWASEWTGQYQNGRKVCLPVLERVDGLVPW